MFSILTTNGQAVIDLADSTSDKIRITGFKVGDLAVSVPDLRPQQNDYDFSGHPNFRNASYIESNFVSRYVGTDATITYLPVSDTIAMIRCFLPQDVPYFQFNSVLLYVTIDNITSLLSLHYSLDHNPKFSTLINRTGTKYYFLLNLKIANRDLRFDFSNLETESPEFDVVGSLFDIPFAPFKEHDQFVLEKHEQTEHVGPFVVFNSMDQFFAAPLFDTPFDEEHIITIPSQNNYYSHNEGDAIPVGFELLVDGDDVPILDRFGKQIVVRIVP